MAQQHLHLNLPAHVVGIVDSRVKGDTHRVREVEPDLQGISTPSLEPEDPPRARKLPGLLKCRQPILPLLGNLLPPEASTLLALEVFLARGLGHRGDLILGGLGDEDPAYAIDLEDDDANPGSVRTDQKTFSGPRPSPERGYRLRIGSLS